MRFIYFPIIISYSLWSISISNIGIPDIGSGLNGLRREKMVRYALSIDDMGLAYMSSATLSFDRSTISYGIVTLVRNEVS